jgi:predicted transcriptional regulator
MLKVNDLLKSKSKRLGKDSVISPYSSILEAIKKMTEQKIDALAVLDEGKIVGIIEKNIFLKKFFENKLIDMSQPVFRIMEMKVLYVSKDFTLEECLALMSNKKIFYLPVLEGDIFLDMISLHEVAERIVEESEYLVSHLSQYISGNLVFNSITALPTYVSETILDTSECKKKYKELPT